MSNNFFKTTENTQTTFKIKQVLQLTNFKCFGLSSSFGIHYTDLGDVMRPWEREQFPEKVQLEMASKNLSYDSRFPLQIINKRKEDSAVHHGEGGSIDFIQ